MPDTTQTGLYIKLMRAFEADPTKLWTYDDFVEEFDIEFGSIQNGVFYLYRDGKILRHIEKHPESKQFQHALEINASNAIRYVKGEPNANKQRSGQLSTHKIRHTITKIMNELAELEDEVITLTEAMDAKIKKIEDILR